MKIVSAQQLYEADRISIKNQGITAIDLMERAATLCFHWIDKRLNGNKVLIHVFCGTGNNGGDGLVIARLLHQYGYHIKTHVLNCGSKRSEAFLTNYERLKELGVWPEVISCVSELPAVSENDIVIDAIFGLGLTRAPEGIIKEVIQFINSSNAYILSIDFPSGMFADKPVLDKESVVRSNYTLTFQTPKLAFLLPENQAYSALWEVLDIGLDREYLDQVKTNYYIQYKEDILPLYRMRQRFSHKGDFGHTLILGGSFGKIGATVLASRAALTIGSGLVTAYIPKCGYQILQTAIPEVMVEVDGEHELEYFNFEVKPNAIAIGPGMGTAAKTSEGLYAFLKKNKQPLVIDADAINILSANKDWYKLVPKDSVLTPHPKEFERLAGTWKNDFDKLDRLLALSEKYQWVIVLKGAFTAIAYRGILYFNSTGNPALATAGSGDVLTGIITGLIAQGYKPVEAAQMGVYLHGSAADLAMDQQVYETFTASDCIAGLSAAFIDLFSKEAPEVEPEENEEAPDKK